MFDGFVSLRDCRFIMTKDEFRRFKLWIQDKPGRRNEAGRMEWPTEQIALWFHAIQKQFPQPRLPAIGAPTGVKAGSTTGSTTGSTIGIDDTRTSPEADTSA